MRILNTAKYNNKKEGGKIPCTFSVTYPGTAEFSNAGHAPPIRGGRVTKRCQAKARQGSWHRRIRDRDREGRGREGEGVAQEGVVLGGHSVADRRDQGAWPRPAGGGGWQPSGIATKVHKLSVIVLIIRPI